MATFLTAVTRAVAPPGTPEPILKLWEDVFRKAVEKPDLVQSIEGKGTVIDFRGRQAYIAFLKKDVETTTRIAKAVGLSK